MASSSLRGLACTIGVRRSRTARCRIATAAPQGHRSGTRVAPRLALAARDLLFHALHVHQIQPRSSNRRGVVVRAMQATWEAQFDKTPYEIIGATKDATEEELKAQYRKLVKQYHPDVVKDMDKDEAEHRFITLQSAYELLMDAERRAEYDKEHRDHPLAANQAFQAYIHRRKKAFDQRGDLAMVGWAEQQRLTNNEQKRHWEQKGDEDARRRSVQQQTESTNKYNSITGKHMLVMKKRQLKAKQEAGELDLAMALLAAEGFELEDEAAFLKSKVDKSLKPGDEDRLLRG